MITRRSQRLIVTAVMIDKNMKQIKKIVQSGELGDIYYIQTGGSRRRGYRLLTVLPLSKMQQQVWVRWAISDATAWIWC